MKVFCFHSIRTLPEVPPASAWPSEKHYHEYVKYLRVDPSWYYAFLTKAIDHWGSENITLTFDDAYRDAMVPAMHARTRDVRTIIFTSTDMVGKGLFYSPLDTMNWPELQWANSYGKVEIGHHGCSHIPWSGLSQNHVEGEIRAGSEAMGEMIRGESRILAPPHGDYTKEHYEYARNHGFDEVFGTILYPVGHYGTARSLANMTGYLDPHAETLDGCFVPWPWEE